MPNGIDLAKFKSKAKLTDRYPKQLQRLQTAGIAPACIEQAVTGAIANLAEAKTSSLVIYGEPQSGKTVVRWHLVSNVAIARRRAPWLPCSKR